MSYELPTFPYRRAPEMDGRKTRHPVAVVGGGLAGLAAACDLAARGVPVVLLDEDDTVGVRGASSRGICYAQRSLEVFDRLGVYDRIAAKGVTWSVGRVLADDDELYAFDLQLGSESVQPPFVNIQQFYVEWFLVDRLAELPCADVRWRNKVVAARPANDHVKLDIETADGSYVLEAEWVVDASGLASAVRQSLGVAARASRGEDRWCICDVRFARPSAPERWTWVRAPFNENRAVWQHQMADGVWRLDYQVAPGEDPAEVATARLRAHFPHADDMEVVWIGPWSYRYHLLDSFRSGRVFFAGDVAHTFGPFGARGGNSGIQDAENIAWKLAAVVQGRAGEALLDSYDAERRPAGAFNVMTSTRTNRFLAPESPWEHALRDATLALARRHEFARKLVNTGRLSTPFRYEASPLTTDGGQALPNAAVQTADGPGTLSDLLRRAGTALLVLRGPGCDPVTAEGCVAVDVSNLAPPGTALLVRPDGHLAATLPGGAGLQAAADRAWARAA